VVSITNKNGKSRFRQTRCHSEMLKPRGLGRQNPTRTGMDRIHGCTKACCILVPRPGEIQKTWRLRNSFSAQENVSLICRGLANRIPQANIVPAREASVTAHNLRFVRRVAHTSGAGEGASKLQPLSCGTGEKLKDRRGPITKWAVATPGNRLHIPGKLFASFLNGAEGFSVEQSIILRKQCLLESLEKVLWSSGLVPSHQIHLDFRSTNNSNYLRYKHQSVSVRIVVSM
jgi:hypothetical protein